MCRVFALFYDKKIKMSEEKKVDSASIKTKPKPGMYVWIFSSVDL